MNLAVDIVVVVTQVFESVFAGNLADFVVCDSVAEVTVAVTFLDTAAVVVTGTATLPVASPLVAFVTAVGATETVDADAQIHRGSYRALLFASSYE